MQHARENTEVYCPRFSTVGLAWEVLRSGEGEDYCKVRLSYRPARRFNGDQGVEQFTIDKRGSIEDVKIVVGKSEPSEVVALPVEVGVDGPVQVALERVD